MPVQRSELAKCITCRHYRAATGTVHPLGACRNGVVENANEYSRARFIMDGFIVHLPTVDAQFGCTKHSQYDEKNNEGNSTEKPVS